jgi:hypothetical protein
MATEAERERVMGDDHDSDGAFAAPAGEGAVDQNGEVDKHIHYDFAPLRGERAVDQNGEVNINSVA